MTTVDGRKARGSRTRTAIMGRAVNIASVEGLDGLSIGSLASEASLSKSGVVGLFGSKEQLQLATIAAAREVFVEAVIQPALEHRGGLDRIHALFDAWLDYSDARIFEGGCFFAAATAEFRAKPGPIKKAIADAMEEWFVFVRRTIERAVERGELPADADPTQLAFETTAVLDAANSRSLLTDSAQPYVHARTALARIFGDW